MDFELTDDQVALQSGMRSFLRGRFPIAEVRASEAAPAVVDRARWHELGDMGVFSLTDQGFGYADAALVFEELGRSLVPGPLVPTALASGLIGDAASGDAVVGLVEDRDGPLIVEHPASNTVLLVLRDDGLWQVDQALLMTTAVERPLDALTPVAIIAGPLPRGERVADAGTAAQWRLRGATLTAALQLGVALEAIDLATAYAKERQQFGKPIGSFQAVKHMCADMLVKAEVARAAVYAAAVNLDGKGTDDVDRCVAGAKLLAGEAALFCGKTAIQVHGGMGFTWEVDAQRYWKRACVLDTQFGSSGEHALSIAGSID